MEKPPASRHRRRTVWTCPSSASVDSRSMPRNRRAQPNRPDPLAQETPVMTRRRLVLATATLLHTGCTSPDNDFLTIVRDSADVLIAESPLEASGDEWRLQLPSVLLIGRSEGTEDGPDLFGRINQVIRLSSGDIAVAENLAGEIRVFDDGGGHLRTFGGRGEGPGEFANPWTIAELPGETIAAVDPLAERISLFTSSGTFARSFPIPRLPGASAPTSSVGWRTARCMSTP